MAKDYEDNYNDYSTNKNPYAVGDRIKKMAIIGAAVLFALLLIAFGVIFMFSGAPDTKTPIVEDPWKEDDPEEVSTGIDRFLPDNEDQGGNGNGNGNGFDADNKAESLLFADFYESEDIDYDFQIDTYDLPINTKTEASNYYYISRRFDLDPYSQDLNESGTVKVDNIFGREVDDFYSAHKKLKEEGIPIFMSSDFVIYYYQNILKNSFKEIEKSVFYENLWEIAERFYEISSTRYKKDFMKKGIANDPILEAKRLEASYFAVMLELLKPTEGQINKNNNFSDETKFSQQDAKELDYVLSDLIKNDVLEEVDLIRRSSQKTESPVFFYEKDYKSYSVPEGYSKNAKLKNFYLVTKWMNSLFPLYFQDEGCPDCLLDREDWRISLAAANLIARDFYDNQELKNDWASIYKIVSFFNGLRQDLTYLHFYDSFQGVFGDRKIEDVFSRDNDSWDSDYKKYQESILEIEFSELEGSFSRENPALKSKIGMRMLQENYWPNDSVFASLTGEDIYYKKGSKDGPLKFTACDSENLRNSAKRCISTGLDIIDLVYPMDNNDFYLDNIDYVNFGPAKESLDRKLMNFTEYSWQNNNYWSTLDTINVFLNSPKHLFPIFMQSNSWEQKDVDTALGAWTNIHLPADEFIIDTDRTVSSLRFGAECNKYNYIEPNIELIVELQAKTDMLKDMIVALKLGEKTNVVTEEFNELNENLSTIKNIIQKELRNEVLENSDCEFIEEFATLYKIENKSQKEFVIKMDNGARVRENISGIDFVLLVKKFDDLKVILVGPVFNYNETRR